MTEPGGPDPNQPGWGAIPGQGEQPGWGPPPPGYGQPPPPGYGAPPPPGYGYGAPPGYGQPPPYYGPAPNDGKAVGALVSALIAWFLCPVIPAIVALVLAGQSSRQIRESGGRLGGAGMNTAAKVMSWINIVFWIGLIALFAAFAATAGNTVNDFSETNPNPYATFESFEQ